MKLWIVDAFAERPFTGNPAAITLVEDFPSEERCQAIAGEMNLSETVFVKPIGSDHFHIRWFTPWVEVPLWGHGTLAAAHLVFQEGLGSKTKIRFDSLSGPLFVRGEGRDIILDFPLQKNGDSLPLSVVAGLFAAEPLHAVQALEEIIVELANEAQVRTLVLDPADVKKVGCRTLIVTAKGAAPYDFVSRVFAPLEGIDEDPVTGSAHCKLADYWQKKLGKTQFSAYQASPRGGKVGVQIVSDRVHLTGQAVTVLEGVLRV